MSAFEFKLPDIGEGLSEGEIVRWLVAPSERAEADQILVEVETDKAVVEIPAPVTGVLTTQGGQPGDVLAIGALLAIIETDGKAPAVAAAHAESVAGEPAKATPVSAPPKPAATEGARAKRVLASPATRKLATQLGIDLAPLEGSGARGQITREDVERAAQPSALAAPSEPQAAAAAGKTPRPLTAPRGEDEVVPLRGLRRRIAQSMTESWRNIPHITSMREIDADHLVAARASLRAEFEDDGVNLTYLPLFIKAVVAALKRHPSFNATLDVDASQIIYRHRYNIGIATATPDGLIVPVIHDADVKSLLDIAREIESLSEAARGRKIAVGQLQNGTFTITNFGSYGGWLGTPIIRPPEVGIAGFGRIREAVVPVDGQPAIRWVLPLVVATDHRLNDGEQSGGFMNTLSTFLSQPIRLLGQL